ncbi:MAG: hypothetical protein RJA36_544 [Pseudomonadota bacterium]|jgi:surfeit locus 1 family protein
MRSMGPTDAVTSPRSRAARLLLVALALALCAGFLALGSWQLARRAWKLDLIERVEQRVHAPAEPAPGPERWPQVSAAGDEYRHVRLSGRYLAGRDTLVQASTALGRGFWVLTPLQDAAGTVVLVNRGFVPEQVRAHPERIPVPGGEIVVSGLLRLSEPRGWLLRSNDPAAGLWYSRDVAAIAARQGLERVAPYFVDADAADASGRQQKPPAGETSLEPVGGLTVVSFNNQHLVYALTWFGLALMAAGAAWLLWSGKAFARD